MKPVWLILAMPLFLAACGESDSNQSDPINNTPPSQPANTAPADRDPTPQSGSGGPSPSTGPSGTVNGSSSGQQ